MYKLKHFLPLLFFTATFVHGQSSTESNSCYEQWAKIFETRGAYNVEDGTYSGIIISIRRGSQTECYTGKAVVEKGEIKSMAFEFVDGSYEYFFPTWKYDDAKMNVINGISRTMQTIDNELINVLFINNLKPKKKAYKRAPLPAINEF